MSYIDTFYARTLVGNTDRPSLRGAADCDVCIIGGGLAGLTTALQLARAGIDVTVLEAERIGWGASGRNGGFVTPGFANGNDAIVRMAGSENARSLHAMSIEGVRFVRDTIEQLGITSAKPVAGITGVTRSDNAEALRAEARYLQTQFDYPVSFLERDEVRAMLRSDRYFQGLRDLQSFHIHPLNYLLGLATEIERLGGRIYEASPAITLDYTTPQIDVKASAGRLNARRLVITTGGYTTGLVPRLKASFLPIATYVMLSEAAPDLLKSAIATSDGIGDDRRAGDYYRLVEGGNRLLWGGRITTRAADTAGIVSQLRHEMVTTYPQLAALKTEIAWSGLMSYARHLMPQIGALRDNVFYCTAFGGHGLNTTALGGKLIAEAVLGESDRYQMFAPFGLQWTGGVVGLAAAQLTYWKLQAQDLWRERSK